ncbi:MAG: cytochrome P450 [Pseudonocardiaceae bacterium]
MTSPLAPSLSGLEPPTPSDLNVLAAWLDDDPTVLSILTQSSASGDVVRIPFGATDAYLVTKPTLIAEVLLTRESLFQPDPGFVDAFTPLLGDGPLTSNGDHRHRRRRRQDLHRVLSASLAAMRRLIPRATDELLRQWNDSETRDLSSDLEELHWRILTTTALGGENGDSLPRPSPDLDKPLSARPVLWDQRWLALRSIVEKALDAGGRSCPPGESSWIRLLRAVSDDCGEPRRSSASLLADELITLMFAARDTTTSALVWSTVALAQHPGLQERIRAELHANGPVTDLVDLRVPIALHNAITEALRLYPPSPLLTRQTIIDVELGGYRIPGGATLLLSPWATHRDPRLFPEPNTFRPERWRLAPKHEPLTYFPFGAGQRMCVGRAVALTEVSLVLATILSRYRIRLEGPAPAPRLCSTLVPAAPLRVHIEGCK